MLLNLRSGSGVFGHLNFYFLGFLISRTSSLLATTCPLQGCSHTSVLIIRVQQRTNGFIPLLFPFSRCARLASPRLVLYMGHYHSACSTASQIILDWNRLSPAFLPVFFHCACTTLSQPFSYQPVDRPTLTSIYPFDPFVFFSLLSYSLYGLSWNLCIYEPFFYL